MKKDKYEQFIQDAAAYLRFAFKIGESNDVILETLVHDISGLANKERCFWPRVDGYAAQERREAKQGAPRDK